MQSLITLTVALLAAAVSAAPVPQGAPQTTTVQFANNSSGRNVNVNVLVTANRLVMKVSTLLPAGGDVFTSIMLQANFEGVMCNLVFPDGAQSITVTSQRTYADFVPAGPRIVSNADITCYRP